jgi:MFS family permease
MSDADREDARASLTRLLIGQGVSSTGDGLWFSTWIIYLTSVAGYSPAVVGATVGIAGVVGIVAAYPLGAAADHFGARNTLVVVCVVRGVAALAFCFVDSLASLLVVAIMFFGTHSGGNGVRTTMVCALFASSEHMAVLGRVRVVQHIGYAVGAGLGAGVLALDRPAVFLASLVVNAVTFVVLAALTASMPGDPPRRREPAAVGARGALRNHPFNVVMLVTALFALCWPLLTTGIPLWLRHATAAPTWLAAVVMVIGSVCVALFQVRVNSRAVGVPRAARAAVVSGLALGLCCLLLAVARWPGPVVASVLTLVAGFAHVFGELYFVAARWGLSVALMDPGQVGRYQGSAAASEAAVQAVGPAVVTLVVTAPGVSGWIALAVVFVGAGMATRLLAPWARRRS